MNIKDLKRPDKTQKYLKEFFEDECVSLEKCEVKEINSKYMHDFECSCCGYMTLSKTYYILETEDSYFNLCRKCFTGFKELKQCESVN